MIVNSQQNRIELVTRPGCDQLGSGALVVQLGQPYALDSMRLLLWDCDDRSYSYYIEVSRNEKDWDLVCDRSEAPCRYFPHQRLPNVCFFTPLLF